ncbi:ribonuclease H-like domain-containing protein [Tanacetum coccineum]
MQTPHEQHPYFESTSSATFGVRIELGEGPLVSGLVGSLKVIKCGCEVMEHLKVNLPNYPLEALLILLNKKNTISTQDLIFKEKMESQSETTQTVSALKLPVLKTGDYDLWSMRMEHYLTHTDYALGVIMNGTKPSSSTYDDDVMFPFFANNLIVHSLIMTRSGADLITDDAWKDGSQCRWLYGIGGYDWSFQAEEGITNFALMAYTSQGSSCSSSLDSELEEALKEKDNLKLKLEKFEESSNNLTKLINSQISTKDKAGLGYDSQINESEVVHSVFNSRESDVDDSPVNDRFKTSEGFYVVPHPYTGNYMPSRPDLSFAGLDDSVYKTKMNETETSISKTSKDIVEKPKTIRPSAPVIEDWDTDSDNDKKPVLNNKGRVTGQREIRPVWNNAQRVNHQNKLTHPHPKRNFVPTTVATKSGQVPVNAAKQNSPRAATSISTVRLVNTAAPKLKVNDALPKTYSYFKAHSPAVLKEIGNANTKLLVRPFMGALFSNITNCCIWTYLVPTSVRSINHKTYCLVVTDDYSRFSWVFFLATKDETSEILKTFITGKNEQFTNRGKLDYASRFIISTTFWAEAVCTACIVQNCLVTKPHNKTPYELLHGRPPRISFMRPFECPVTILNTLDPLGKFDEKADKGFFIGYSINSKPFRVFNTRTRKVEENLHINFLENKPNVAGSGPDWLFDIDLLTNSMNYEPVTAGNQTNKNADVDDAGKKTNEEPANKGERNGQEKEGGASNKEDDQNIQDF